MLYDEALLNKALERALTALTSLDSSEPVSHTDDAASVSFDSLGEQLFDLVDLYNTGHTQKITGMLLEQKKGTVLQLLPDHSLLEEQVKIALKTLQEQGDKATDVSDSSDPEEVESIGEMLFNIVHQLDPTHCADITGMLLEMDSETLKQILSDRSMLEIAFQRAKSALEGALNPTHTEMSE
ncbi:embryonic polyadenylate-binding protein-like isoform X3 [Carassius carassius]|nr:embryonic polyadenylate-binding protein-like isoform X3 [Carassius carassius]